MPRSSVICAFCSKGFLKDNRHIVENIKLNNKSYCSPQCLSKARYKQVELYCENPSCKKPFMRQPSDISPHNFCSHSCAATITNPMRAGPKIPKVKLTPEERKKRMKEGPKKYWDNYVSVFSPELVIQSIRDFVELNQRLPVKREMTRFYIPARKYFGTWNNAIKEAGFEPNPILFADHCIAKDGHRCDSLAEKKIDDFLSDRQIPHERRVPYPQGVYTADFRIGNMYVEYFGLAGEVKAYDRLKQKKIRLAKQYKLNIIEVYPQDLYKKNGLEELYLKIAGPQIT